MAHTLDDWGAFFKSLTRTDWTWRSHTGPNYTENTAFKGALNYFAVSRDPFWSPACYTLALAQWQTAINNLQMINFANNGAIRRKKRATVGTTLVYNKAGVHLWSLMLWILAKYFLGVRPCRLRWIDIDKNVISKM